MFQIGKVGRAPSKCFRDNARTNLMLDLGIPLPWLISDFFIIAQVGLGSQSHYSEDVKITAIILRKKAETKNHKNAGQEDIKSQRRCCPNPHAYSTSGSVQVSPLKFHLASLMSLLLVLLP